MDYPTIQQIILSKSLATDPAFDALRIGIEAIPPTNGCPLGLYDPDIRTIIIPPDAQEATLLHELGHRHGHYYYNDLSEAYAEYFRKIYQPKGAAMLYAGNDIRRLPRFEPLFEESERGALEVALFQPLTPDELLQIKSQLCSYGEPPPRCYYGDGGTPFVRFEFVKGIEWLTIIGAVLAGLTAVTAGIIGYAIYKVAQESPWIAPLAIAGVISAIILGLGLGAKYAPQLRAQWEKLA